MIGHVLPILIVQQPIIVPFAAVKRVLAVIQLPNAAELNHAHIILTAIYIFHAEKENALIHVLLNAKINENVRSLAMFLSAMTESLNRSIDLLDKIMNKAVKII